MIKNQNNQFRTVLVVLISMISSLLQVGTSVAITGYQQLQDNQIQNTTQQQQQFIQSTGITCSGKIDSEVDGPDSGIPYAYKYNVTWTINVNGLTSSDNYSVTYSGVGVTANTLYNQLDSNIANPLYVQPFYVFKKTDPDKTVKLNVSMSHFGVSPAKAYSTSCSLALVNKGAPAITSNTIDDSQLSNPQLAFVLQQITPVPTTTTDTTPSYTFKTTRAGSITYGGDCSSPTSNASVGNNTVTFNALSAGTHSNCTIMVTDANQVNSPVLNVNSFTVEAAASSSSDNTNTTEETTGTTTEQTSAQTTTTLLPGPDILTCKARAKYLYFEFDEPAYDRMGLDCTLTNNALVSVGIYKKEYDPKAADNSANLLKQIKTEQVINKGLFYVDWTGYDDYDQPVALGEYNFVVEAALDQLHSPDISIQQFTIVNAPGAGGEVVEASANNVTNENLKGAAEEPKEGILESVAKAVFGDNSATASQQAANANREASKCPNIFYPTDIGSSPYKDKIRQAYDECLVRGYDDGTFRPQQSLTRAEATKIIVLASGNLAKQGCFDVDCGSPFVDLDSWQGPWIRAAWDLKIVSGVGPGVFAPNRSITRAEAVALTTKAFKIPLHVGCYDADCGANYQRDIFTDIVLMWQGPYLRALADRGVIESAAPGKFFPDVAITREQYVDMALRAKAAK